MAIDMIIRQHYNEEILCIAMLTLVVLAVVMGTETTDTHTRKSQRRFIVAGVAAQKTVKQSSLKYLQRAGRH